MGSMIPKGSKVLLDSVSLIYFLETNERYSQKAEEIFTHIESGELLWLSFFGSRVAVEATVYTKALPCYDAKQAEFFSCM